MRKLLNGEKENYQKEHTYTITESQSVNKDRKIYLDAIKILAIILVIYNHTGLEGFLAFGNGKGFIKIVELLISILCKTAVPLFFMCSGVVLLNKDETIKELLTKRVLRYFVILILFTLCYYIFLSIRDNNAISIPWILKTTYEQTTFSFSGSYWFIYSYIGFLLILPVLRIIAKNMTKELMNYLLFILFITSGVLPIFEYIVGLSSIAISVPFILSTNIIYPLIGYYYDTNVFRKFKFVLIPAFISIISSTIITIDVSKSGATELYLYLFGPFLSIFIFFLVKMIFEKYLIGFARIKYLISEISKCTFGIYLIHGFVFTLLNDYFVMENYFDAWIGVTIVFFISLVIIYLMKKIPYLNKII